MSSIPPKHERRSTRALQLLEAARIAHDEGKGELAYGLLCQCIDAARAANDTLSLAHALTTLAQNVSLFAPPIEADIFDYREELCRAALDLFKTIQEPRGIAHVLRILAGNKPIPEAKELLQQSLEISRRVRDVAGIVRCLEALGHLAFIEGDRHSGRAMKHEALALAHESGDMQESAHVLFSIALTDEDGEQRVGMFEEAARRFEAMGMTGRAARSHAYCALLACDDSQLAKKEHHLQKAIELCRKIDNEVLEATCCDGLADVARRRGDEALATSYEARAGELCSDLHVPQDATLAPAELNLETLRNLMRQVIGKQTGDG